MSWKNLSLNLRRWNVTHPQPKWQQTPKPLILKRQPHTRTGHSHNHNPYPYPTHRNPTPHQLFHLPRNATKAEIKARYYDLVRIYHPDKVHDAISPEIAQSRFQAITAAYDVLRGKTPLHAADASIHPRPGGHPSDTQAQYRSTAAYRAARQRRQELYSSGAVDDTTKDRLILAGVVLTIIFVIAHTATTRREALAEAINRSRNVSAQYPLSQRTGIDDRRLSLDASRHEGSETEKTAFPHS